MYWFAAWKKFEWGRLVSHEAHELQNFMAAKLKVNLLVLLRVALPQVYRRDVKDLSKFYKLKCGHFSSSFNPYFWFCSDERLRSHANNKLKNNRFTTELFKGTFFNRVPCLWNDLPDALRTANCSISSFKRLCNNFYKDRGFDPKHPYTTWAKISN